MPVGTPWHPIPFRRIGTCSFECPVSLAVSVQRFGKCQARQCIEHKCTDVVIPFSNPSGAFCFSNADFNTYNQFNTCRLAAPLRWALTCSNHYSTAVLKPPGALKPLCLCPLPRITTHHHAHAHQRLPSSFASPAAGRCAPAPQVPIATSRMA